MNNERKSSEGHEILVVDGLELVQGRDWEMGGIQEPTIYAAYEFGGKLKIKLSSLATGNSSSYIIEDEGGILELESSLPVCVATRAREILATQEKQLA